MMCTWVSRFRWPNTVNTSHDRRRSFKGRDDFVPDLDGGTGRRNPTSQRTVPDHRYGLLYYQNTTTITVVPSLTLLVRVKVKTGFFLSKGLKVYTFRVRD